MSNLTKIINKSGSEFVGRWLGAIDGGISIRSHEYGDLEFMMDDVAHVSFYGPGSPEMLAYERESYTSEMDEKLQQLAMLCHNTFNEITARSGVKRDQLGITLISKITDLIIAGPK